MSEVIEPIADDVYQMKNPTRSVRIVSVRGDKITAERIDDASLKRETLTTADLERLGTLVEDGRIRIRREDASTMPEPPPHVPPVTSPTAAHHR